MKVLAFAGARDVIGAAEMSVELSDELSDAGQLMDWLCRRHPQLQGYRGAIRLAVNNRYVDDREPLRAGDEVALIPPVAGG